MIATQDVSAVPRTVRSARILLAGQAAVGLISLAWIMVMDGPELQLLRWATLRNSSATPGGATRYSMLGSTTVGSSEVLALRLILTPLVMVVVPIALAAVLGARRPRSRWLTVGAEALLVVLATLAMVGPLLATALLGMLVIMQLVRPTSAAYFKTAP